MNYTLYYTSNEVFTINGTEVPVTEMKKGLTLDQAMRLQDKMLRQNKDAWFVLE